MPYPDKPDLDYSYTGFQQSQGSNDFPGTQLDNDLANVKASIDDVIDFLKSFTRSDGRLANASVGREQLDSSILLGFNPPTGWVSGHDYVVSDTVFHSDVFYVCQVAHTSSGSFATDLAAGYWLVLADFSAETAAAQAAAAAAATSETNAAASAAAASSSASTASTKATQAATSATNAATSETNAAGSASTATSKASQAAASQTAAATSATNAAASATAAADTFTNFDVRYLGAKTSDPTTDNTGGALINGAMYFNTSTGKMRVWNGTIWSDVNGATASATSFSPTGNVASTNVQAAIAEVDSEKLALAGGTMTGAITLSGDPTANLQPATKQYADNLAQKVATLVDGATPALDASAGTVFDLTALGDRTISVPTNPVAGKKIIIRHKASGANRTLALNTGVGGFRFGTDVTALSTTTSGKTDFIGAIYNATDQKWDVVAYMKGF
jgi:hypothetical protein